MTPDELFALRKRYLELADHQTQIAEEQAEIKRRIRDAHQIGYKMSVGDGQVQIQANRRFDANKGAEMLPTDELRQLCRPDGYDPKKIRKLLPPAIQELCFVNVGEPRVVIT